MKYVGNSKVKVKWRESLCPINDIIIRSLVWWLGASRVRGTGIRLDFAAN